MSYLVNIDIGGTHTDAVAIDEDGAIISGKVPSTPGDFSEGFFNVLDLLSDKLDCSTTDLLESTDLLSHGTTVGTNALIEGTDSSTALVTTKGMESVLSIMRGARGRTSGLSVEEFLHMQTVEKPEPLVERQNIYGINERIDCMGDVVVPFNEEQARDVARTIQEEGIESVAVSFLWSFLNDEHEKRMVQILEDELDDVFITTSSELVPVWGEYERTAATAINSLIGPETSSYIDKINRRLNELGHDGPLLIMKVGGGVAPAEDAIREPIHTIDSGPAGGLMGCSFLADLLEHQNVIGGDMGGTSFDVGLVIDGKPITEDTNVVRQYDYRIRNLDVESIGNGGGSIAWVEESTGRLRVGPQSAGADPGPACYDKGGEDFTITDADLLCGFLDPDYFLGGRGTLERELSEKACRPIAEKLGMDVMEVAEGVLEISNTQMADLISQRTINKGFDPREFNLYAYGGAGPLHVPFIARRLGIDTVVIPTGDSSSVWSALGISSADVLYRQEVSNIRSFAPFDPDDVTGRFRHLEDQVSNRFEEMGFDRDEVRLERYANLSYGMQVHEVTVPVPPGELTVEALGTVIDNFEDKYEQMYGEGAGASETGFELVTLRCDGFADTTKPQLDRGGDAGSARLLEPGVTDSILWPGEGEWLDSGIYTMEDMEPHVRIPGPAVLRLENTTVAVPPTDEAHVDRFRNIILEEV